MDDLLRELMNGLADEYGIEMDERLTEYVADVAQRYALVKQKSVVRQIDSALVVD